MISASDKGSAFCSLWLALFRRKRASEHDGFYRLSLYLLISLALLLSLKRDWLERGRKERDRVILTRYRVRGCEIFSLERAAEIEASKRGKRATGAAALPMGTPSANGYRHTLAVGA
jgi:hypothetical protein